MDAQQPAHRYPALSRGIALTRPHGDSRRTQLEGGLEAGRNFLNQLKMLSLTANLGDTKSIASHPASGPPAVVNIGGGIVNHQNVDGLPWARDGDIHTRLLAVQPRMKHGKQVLAVDWLRKIVPGTCFDATLAVAFHCLRGDCDDRQRPSDRT